MIDLLFWCVLRFTQLLPSNMLSYSLLLFMRLLSKGVVVPPNTILRSYEELAVVDLTMFLSFIEFLTSELFPLLRLCSFNLPPLLPIPTLRPIEVFICKRLSAK